MGAITIANRIDGFICYWRHSQFYSNVYVLLPITARESVDLSDGNSMSEGDKGVKNAGDEKSEKCKRHSN